MSFHALHDVFDHIRADRAFEMFDRFLIDELRRAVHCRWCFHGDKSLFLLLFVVDVVVDVASSV